MFAVYMFAGTFVQGIAAITLAAVLLHERGLFRDWITENQFHDLGKMLFAFSTFWAYIWVCQYLLIWYGNIPEEVTHYISRTNGSWLALYTVNFLINWILPFSVLLSAGAKRRTKVLKFVTVALLLGHWLDLYQLIMPAFHPAAPSLNVVDLFITAGYGALFYLMFIRSLAKAPLVPVNDPILCYSSMLTNSASAAAPLAALSRRLEPRTKHFLEQSNHEGL